MQTEFAEFIEALYKGVSEETDIIFAEKPRNAPTVSVSPRDVVAFLEQADAEKPLFLTPSTFVKNTVRGYGKGRLDRNVQTVTSLFFDFDKIRFELSQLTAHNLPEPSFVLRRQDRAHVYFLIEPVSFTGPNDPERDRVNRIIKNITALLESDPTPAHVGTFLRVPYFVHVKEGVTSEGYTISKEESSKKRYRLEDFARFIPPESDEKTINDKKKKAEPVSIDTKEMLLAPRPVIGQGEGRSLALFHFGGRCRDFGLSEEEAQSLAVEFNHKFLSPPEHEPVVRHQINSAYVYAKGPAGRYLAEKPDKVAQIFSVDNHIARALKGWVYVLENETLRSMEGGRVYSTQGQIQNALQYLTGLSTKLGYILQHRLITVVDGVKFRPDQEEERFITEHNRTSFNTYQRPIPPAPCKTKKENAAYVKTFLEHLKLLTTTEEEYEHLLDYITVSLTRPGVKIKHSIVLVSTKEGLGKGFLHQLYKNCLGSSVSEASNKDLANGNNGWMDSKLACFALDVSQNDRFSVYDAMKTWITDSPIPISDKYLRSYPIDNFCNFFFLSNHPNALPPSSHDRRLFVIINTKSPESPEYYKRLHEAFTIGAGAIFEFLSLRDYAFDPEAPAPLTEGKKEMMRLARSEFFLFLDELYETGKLDEVLQQPAFSLGKLYDRVFYELGSKFKGAASQKQLVLWLKEQEFAPVEIHRVLDGKRLHLRLFSADLKSQAALKKLETGELVKL